MDARAASWYVKGIGAPERVGAIVPECFARYARIFHPAYLYSVLPRHRKTVRWRDIAAANRRTIVGEMNALGDSCVPSRFSLGRDVLWTEQPAIGALPRELAVRFVDILAAYTTVPDECFFAVWEGFTILAPWVRRAPTFSAPFRRYYLLKGRLSDVLDTLSYVDDIYRSPSLWWPSDRAWCVSTEVDFAWTYVGGSAACVADILSDAALEAVATNAGEGHTMRSATP